MFEQIIEQFDSVLKKLRGLGKITDKNIQETCRMVRRILLEADVSLSVVQLFIKRIRAKAEGTKVLKSIQPGEQFIHIINNELVELLGKDIAPLTKTSSPTIVLLVGLQGSGKTTTCAKLAKKFKDEGQSVLLVAADVYRPAAIEQLKKICVELSVEIYSNKSSDPVYICEQAVEEAKIKKNDFVIIDTAGRLHVDGEMMVEIQKISDTIKPAEILFVVDAMSGQDAVNSAKVFSEALSLTGTILTKMDGDSRGGVAVSITEVTGKPIKFIGTSEKIDGLDAFDPKRIAGQILGFGDTVSLVKKVQAAVDKDEAIDIQKKIKENRFDLSDFLVQIKQVQKMGSMNQIIGMLPNMNRKILKSIDIDENQFIWIEAMINSMTQKERTTPRIVNGSRRQRIANGSGRTIQEVNQLLKQFFLIQKTMKKNQFIGTGIGGNMNKLFHFS